MQVYETEDGIHSSSQGNSCHRSSEFVCNILTLIDLVYLSTNFEMKPKGKCVEASKNISSRNLISMCLTSKLVVRKRDRI